MDNRGTLLNNICMIFPQNRTRLILLLILITLPVTSIWANQVIYDKKYGDVTDLFTKGNSKYIIRYNHKFDDKVVIPSSCEIFLMEDV